MLPEADAEVETTEDRNAKANTTEIMEMKDPPNAESAAKTIVGTNVKSPALTEAERPQLIAIACQVAEDETRPAAPVPDQVSS